MLLPKMLGFNVLQSILGISLRLSTVLVFIVGVSSFFSLSAHGAYSHKKKQTLNSFGCYGEFCPGKHVLTADGKIASIASLSAKGRATILFHEEEKTKEISVNALTASVKCNKVCVGQVIGIERGNRLYKGYVKMAFKDGRVVLVPNDKSDPIVFHDVEIGFDQQYVEETD